MKSPSFRAITASPLNGASTNDVLVRSYATPVADFFVRNHGNPPVADEWTLKVTGMVERPLEIALPDLIARNAYPVTRVPAVLQCAGNRRTALQAVKPIAGELPWDNAAIGCAAWGGVRLADLLQQAGVTAGAAHVWLLGGETLEGKHAGTPYGASIPLDKALHRSTLVATTMNGDPLPPDHGAPVRAVVPGYVGARSVKWLREIRVQSEETPNYFQRAYSVSGRVLYEYPVSSAFGLPLDGATIASGGTRVRGWALGQGGVPVEHIEISTDDGRTWSAARFTTPAVEFAWRLWEAEVVLPPGTHRLACRAVDAAGNTQPETAESTWNEKGYVNNCWDRVTVHAR